MSKGFGYLASLSRQDSALLVAFFTLQYLGVCAILSIIHHFDATTAQVVGSTRRILTFLLSFVIFPKPFGRMHAVGLALVVSSAWAMHGLKTGSSARHR